MYIDRVKKFRDKFEELVPAQQVKMSTWISQRNRIDVSDEFLADLRDKSVSKSIECGTVGCLAGWGALLCGLNKQCIRVSENEEWNGSDYVPYIDATFDKNPVTDYFGFSNSEARGLFSLDWPAFLLPEALGGDNDFDEFDHLKPKVRKQAIVDILDYIIKYGFTWLDEGEQSARHKHFKKELEYV